MPKVPRTPHRGDLRKIDNLLGDITGKLDRMSTLNASWSHDVSSVLGKYRDLGTRVNKIVATAKATGKYTKAQLGQIRDLKTEIDSLPGKWNIVTQFVGKKMATAFDRLGKSIVGLGLATFERGLADIHVGLYKVWELQERWTKAMGALNMRIGALSPNMQGFTKEARRWEGAIRGLTDNFGEGLQMAQDFIEGFGRILPEQETAKWGKLGLGVARGLGLGGEAAGSFLKSMYQLDQNTTETTETFGHIIASAKAAGVSVNSFSREIVQSRDFMVSFGKEGQKAFIQSAAFAKKLGVSLKSLEQFTKSTDNFDATAQAVAKLNTVFGTTINSLDLMLEQDPGKRLETVRQQLLGQGKDFSRLSRQERELIAETLHLSEEEVAGVLKSGKSLEEFQADANKEKEKQVNTEKLIQKAMARTAQTMFAFGAAWDQVTKSITLLIKPFTDVLGLTKDGDKHTRSFGQVMSAVFGRLNTFIREVAKNKDWQHFMRELARDAEELFKKISRAVTRENLRKWLHSAVKGAQDFYHSMQSVVKVAKGAMTTLSPVFKFVLEHINEILVAWLGLKAAIGGIRIAGILKDLFNVSSLTSAASSAGGSLGGTLAKSIVGGLASGLAGLGLGSLVNQFITKPILDSIYGTQEEINKAFVDASKKMDGLLGEKAHYEREEATFKDKVLGVLGFGDTRGMKRVVDEPMKEFKKLRPDENLGKVPNSLDLFDSNGEDVGDTNFLVDKRKKKGKKVVPEVVKPERSLEEEAAPKKKEPKAAKPEQPIEEPPSPKKKEKVAVPGFPGLLPFAEPEVQGRQAKPLEDDLVSEEDEDRMLGRPPRKNGWKPEPFEDRNPPGGGKVPSITGNFHIMKEGEKIEPSVSYNNRPDSKVNKPVALNTGDDLGRVAKQRKEGKAKDDETALQKERMKRREELLDQQDDFTKKEIDLAKERIEKGKNAEDEVHKHLSRRLKDEASNDRKLFQLRFLDYLKDKALAFDYRGDVENDLEEILRKNGEQLLDSTAGVRRIFRSITSKMENSVPMAAGGIVTRPTRALIGEAGPEAVIPLKAILGTSRQEPLRIREADVRRIAEEVSRKSEQGKGRGGDVKVVAGDVYLDSAKVGRHVVRQLLTRE